MFSKNFLKTKIYLNHSFIVFGQPIKRSSVRGAPQFADLSTKSQTGIPTIGRKSAVQNPQNTIQRSASRTGFIKIRTASAMSITPIKKRSCVAMLASAIPSLANQPTHSFLPWSAKTPCPKNSPATVMRNTHSIILLLFIQNNLS